MKSALLELVALGAMTLLVVNSFLLLFLTDDAYILIFRVFVFLWAAGETLAMLMSAGPSRAYRAPSRAAIALLAVVSNGLFILMIGLQPRGSLFVGVAMACTTMVVLEWHHQRKRYASMQNPRAWMQPNDKNAPYDW